MPWWRQILDWLGGGLSRAAATGFVGGLAFVLLGMTPAEAVAYVIQHPPAWLMSGWTRLVLVIVGIAAMFAAQRFNVWSQRQRAVDSLAEDLSWAIHHLVNRPRPVAAADADAFAHQLKEDFQSWCALVSKKLGNRAFFTKADQLHFDRLGFIAPVAMIGNASADHTLSMLREKFGRLRDIIIWVQQRPR